MKKVAATIASLGFLASTTAALAQVDVQIGIPDQGVNPMTTVGQLVSNALTIVFVVAALIVLFMLVIGAFQWITSGGDKEGVAKARSRITHALIGLAILALAFLITTVVGQIVGINILNLKSIPTLSAQCPPGTSYDPTASTATGTIVCK